MKIKHVLSTILFCFVTLTGFAQNNQNSSLTYRFATKAEAQMLLTEIDNFSNGLNQFDIDLRLNKVNGRKSEWLRLAMNEALNWSEIEKTRIDKAFKILKANIKKMNLSLSYPDEIVFLKTTMKEECNTMAYTRRNWIALGENCIKSVTDKELLHIIGHELFHVLSRHSSAFKKAAYAAIDFQVTEQEFILPTDIIARRISNPDIERRDSYTTFTLNGVPTKCVQIIYTKKPFTTGSLRDYLSVGFIPLNEDLIPVMKDGQTVIIPLEKVAEEFKAKVGANTNYIIDPEEISADHFSYLLAGKKELANPEIIDAIRKNLSSK